MSRKHLPLCIGKLDARIMQARTQCLGPTKVSLQQAIACQTLHITGFSFFPFLISRPRIEPEILHF